MTTIRQPRVNVAIVNASEPVQNTGQKMLFIGQKLAAGTAPAGSLVKQIGNSGQENELFGEGSMLSTLVSSAKVRNKQIRMDAIPLDDVVGGGVVTATGEIQINGTNATSDGTYTVIIGSERNHKYEIPVSAGDPRETVSTAIEAAINADTSVPVIATDGGTAMTDLEAKNAGTYGNSIAVSVSGEVGGFTLTITPMSGGAVDPDTTNIFDIVSGDRYQAIIWAYPNDTADLRDFLDARFNADGVVLDGVGYTALNDSFANLVALGDSLNSQSLVIIGGKLEDIPGEYEGGDIIEIPLVKASVLASYTTLRLDSIGANIADIVITANGPRDAFGGPALASKPYFNSPFPQMFPVLSGRGFDDSEIESLHDAGISVIGNNTAGNGIVSGEIVTTYKNDFAGNPDITFKYLNYVHTASQAREYFFNNYTARYAQSRLTEGDLVAGRDMANASSIRSYSKRLYQDLSGADFVLLEDGEDALQFFDQELDIIIDKALGKAIINMTVPIVTQLRVIEATMKIAFSANQ